MQLSSNAPQQARKSPLFGMFRPSTPDLFRKASVIPNPGTQPGDLVTRLMADGSIKSATYWGISNKGIPLYSDKGDAKGIEPEQPTASNVSYDYFARQQPEAGSSRPRRSRESFNLTTLNQSLPQLPSFKPTNKPPASDLTEAELADYPALNKITAPTNLKEFIRALNNPESLLPAEERLKRILQERETYKNREYGPDKGKKKDSVTPKPNPQVWDHPDGIHFVPQPSLYELLPELPNRPMTPIGVNSRTVPGMYWDGQEYRPVTPPNSWSRRFLNVFRHPGGSYSNPANPNDPANYSGFQGYDDNNNPIFAHFYPDGSLRGYSNHPQYQGG